MATQEKPVTEAEELTMPADTKSTAPASAVSAPEEVEANDNADASTDSSPAQASTPDVPDVDVDVPAEIPSPTETSVPVDDIASPDVVAANGESIEAEPQSNGTTPDLTAKVSAASDDSLEELLIPEIDSDLSAALSATSQEDDLLAALDVAPKPRASSIVKRQSEAETDVSSSFQDAAPEDPMDETSAVVDEPQEAQETQAVVAPIKPSFASKTLALARCNAKLATACIISMVMGASCVYLFSGNPETSENPAEKKTVYTASLNHRAEPVKPVLPFEELNSEVVALGKRLFNDPGISRSGKVSCASCHSEELAGTDGLVLGRTVDGSSFECNTPSVWNAPLNFALNWIGNAASLEEHLDQHIMDQRTLGADWTRVTKYLKADPYYNGSFKLHLRGEPTQKLIKESLSSYLRSMVPINSKFDQWLQGEDSVLSPDEVAGYYLFRKYNCISCHQGAGVGGSMLQPLGKLKESLADKRALNDYDQGLYAFSRDKRDEFKFRVPSLRDVELTAPYFHDGSAATLDEAVATMITTQTDIELNQLDVQRIAAFLKTLTRNTRLEHVAVVAEADEVTQ